MASTASPAAARRRAIVIGGSMSGLFAGLLLRQRGCEVDVYERVESELAGPRRRHRRAAGGGADLRALGLDTDRARRRHDDAQNPRLRGPPGLRDRMPADAHRLGAASTACCAMRFPAAHYHRGVGLARFEQDGAVGDRAFQRRPQRARPTCWSAPTASARPCGSSCLPELNAALRRLCRLARADCPSGRSRRRSIASCSSS